MSQDRSHLLVDVALDDAKVVNEAHRGQAGPIATHHVATLDNVPAFQVARRTPTIICGETVAFPLLVEKHHTDRIRKTALQGLLKNLVELDETLISPQTLASQRAHQVLGCIEHFRQRFVQHGRLGDCRLAVLRVALQKRTQVLFRLLLAAKFTCEVGKNLFTTPSIGNEKCV
jgi:hypothetical protein